MNGERGLDMDEFFREETPCARKEHHCDLCYGKIEKGEKYEHVVQSESGYVFDDKYHMGCWNLACRYLATRDYNDNFDRSELIDDIRERVCCDCIHQSDCFRQILTCSHVAEKYLRKGKPDANKNHQAGKEAPQNPV